VLLFVTLTNVKYFYWKMAFCSIENFNGENFPFLALFKKLYLSGQNKTAILSIPLQCPTLHYSAHCCGVF